MIINGKEIEMSEGISIREMLKNLNLSTDKVVIEVNAQIISKEKYCEILLSKSDKIEIVSFVGGG